MAEASLRSLWEEASTMFLTWKRLMALSYANDTTFLTTYLSHAAEAVSASDGGHMTSTLLGTSVVSTQGKFRVPFIHRGKNRPLG